jgi:hypothetical protein
MKKKLLLLQRNNMSALCYNENSKYWVGVRKDKYTGHDVIETEGEPQEKDYPQYDYTIGPFDDKEKAQERALIEENKTGMFHPFPGHER